MANKKQTNKETTTTTGPISELDRTSLVNKGFIQSKPFIAETTRGKKNRARGAREQLLFCLLNQSLFGTFLLPSRSQECLVPRPQRWARRCKTGKTLLPSHFSPFHGPLHFTQKRFLRRGSTSGEVQPLTLLYTIFKRDGTPLVYLLFTNGTPFSYNGTSSSGHLSSKDTSIHGIQNRVLENLSHNLCICYFY